jgi:hypothetical protein
LPRAGVNERTSAAHAAFVGVNARTGGRASIARVGLTGAVGPSSNKVTTETTMVDVKFIAPTWIGDTDIQ